MQIITISGTLLTNAEKCTDKNGKNYTRFTVTCGGTDVFGRSQYTHYRCTCYVSGYEGMKKGDQIFLSGNLSAKVRIAEDGKSYLNMDVMVYQVSGGYRANERNKPERDK